MNKLKELQEKLGDARKKLNQFTNERAEKLSQLTALGEKEELTKEEQTNFETLSNEIDAIDKKMSVQEKIADNLKSQITQERLNGDNPVNGGEQFRFQDGGEGPDSEEKEVAKFSLSKAIRDCVETGQAQGYEAEMVTEGRKEMREHGLSTNGGNLILPTNLLNNRNPVNALTATGGTGGDQGGVTIQTDVLSLIDILRSKLPFVDSSDGARDGLGATLWTGLTGNVRFPRAEEDATELSIRTENQTAEELDPSFDDIEMSPKRRAGFAEVSRQLILQSTVGIENWLRNYLMYKLAKSMNINIIDYILGLSGAHEVANGTNGGALDWAKIVSFETGIEDADAEEEERFAWLTHPRVKGKLRTTEISTDTAKFIWGEVGNEVLNYPAFTTTLVPKDLTKGSGEDLSAMIFANWASLYIGMWGPIEMLVNPYSKDKEGLIRLNIWNFMDRIARREESFAVSKDIVTTL